MVNQCDLSSSTPLQGFYRLHVSCMEFFIGVWTMLVCLFYCFESHISYYYVRSLDQN